MLAYLVSLVVLAGIYAVFCLGLNIQWGYTGLFNIGIAGFFAIGAYTSALVTAPKPTELYAQYVKQIFALNLPFPVGLIAAAIMCGVVALLVGFLTLRLGEDYLAIATIGIAETVRLIFVNESWLANGSRGLAGLPQPLSGLVQPRHYNYIYLIIVVGIVIGIYFLIERAIRSPWGRVLRAIREDEVSAAMSGKSVFSYKMQAFIFGAMVMGVGGALYAHYTKAISPEAFTPLYGTFIIWVMVMAGGSGNNKGVILGSFVVWGIWIGTQFMTDLLPLALKSRGPYIRFLLIGILLEIILIYRPQGLLGEEKRVSKLM
ncbi:MAG TPA: branched-chain amino acid ABC transporter permease [bacterium]|nr:branched-chain amino acid ABC transporter permease [bacterium]